MAVILTNGLLMYQGGRRLPKYWCIACLPGMCYYIYSDRYTIFRIFTNTPNSDLYMDCRSLRIFFIGALGYIKNGCLIVMNNNGWNFHNLQKHECLSTDTCTTNTAKIHYVCPVLAFRK